MSTKVRTRFAPSPTGYMHIGNLRTALYAYLYAKANGGDFVLRIEDTDRNRYVEGATRVIYDTLKTAEISHDEGPDVGGDYGPYIQSERKGMYREYAEELVRRGHAYYCFCQKDDPKEDSGNPQAGYNRKCRNLTDEEVEANIAAGKPYVIRQRIPLEGSTGWNDLVFGEITVENSTLDDQILLKSDGMPTYNFANVIDDHLMGITHIIRGSEYLSSNPKYLLLYQAFGWDVPEYIHLPLICGRGEDGTVSKLSKRHGAVSFQDLVAEGYLPSAIINYVALLGWNPGTEQEIFTMEELRQAFGTAGIHKSPAIFDYQKLSWVNGEHLKKLAPESFRKAALPYSGVAGTPLESKWDHIASLMQPRIQKYSEIPSQIAFLSEMPAYDNGLFINKKNKSTLETSAEYIKAALDVLPGVKEWTVDALNETFAALADSRGLKLGRLMWPVRIAVSGLMITPGSATDIMYLIGREESTARLEAGLAKIS